MQVDSPCPHQQVGSKAKREFCQVPSDGEDVVANPEFGPDPLPPMPWFGMDIGGTLSKVGP